MRRPLSENDLTKLLYELRDMGMSTSEVAKQIGVGRVAVWRWINQERYPQPAQLRRILRLSQLVGLSGQATTPGLQANSVSRVR